MGFSLDLSCSVSLSEVIFIPVLSCQEIFFFLLFQSLKQTAAQTRTDKHTQTQHQNTLMNSPA